MPRMSKRARKDLVATTSAGFTTGVTTGWMLLYGAATLREWMELRAATANFRARFRYRTADVTTSRPNAWVTSTTDRSTTDQYIEDVTVSGLTDKLWVQVAVAQATASTGQVGEATVEVQGTLDGNAAIVAADRVQVEPTINASQNAYYPFGSRFQALGLTGVMVGFVLTGVSGTVDYGLAIRYYEGDELEPGAWVDLVGFTGVSADEVRNSGHQAVTPGTNMWAQLGLKISSGTNPRATVQVLGAARWT